jgi:hypothetical protein
MMGRTFHLTDMPRLLRRDGTTFTPPVWIGDRRGRVDMVWIRYRWRGRVSIHIEPR